MLPPELPQEGVAPGWSCTWTASGGRWLVNLLIGDVSQPTTLTFAACVGAPNLNGSAEVTEQELAMWELDPDAQIPLIPATGYVRGTLAVTDLSPTAASYDPAVSVSVNDVLFGSNSGAIAWPEVSHVCLLIGSTVMAIITLTGEVTCQPGFVLRIPSGAFSLLAVTGEAAD